MERTVAGGFGSAERTAPSLPRRESSPIVLRMVKPTALQRLSGLGVGRRFPVLETHRASQFLDVLVQAVALRGAMRHEIGERVRDGVELVLCRLVVAGLTVLEQGDQ